MFPEHAESDEITLTTARIDHEHSERQALEVQRQDLLKKKAGLVADNKKRKDELASLDRDLEKFIDVSTTSLLFSKRLCECYLLTRYRLPNRYKRHLRSTAETESKPSP